MRQSLTNTVEVLLRHSGGPIIVNATTARVVRKAHQRTVLVGVEVLGVVHPANAVLESLDVVCKQGFALCYGDGRADAAAVAVGFAVVAVS